MNKITIFLLVYLALSGCGAVEDMSKMFQKQEMVQEIVKNKYGWESKVGFNIDNGVLTQVTLALNANDVREKKVSELEAIAKEVVLEAFNSRPQTINVQIAFQSDDQS